jgi:protein SCO1/2
MISNERLKTNNELRCYFSVSSFLKLSVFFMLFACQSTEQKKQRVLPIIGNYDVIYKTVNGKTVTDTVYPSLPDFSFRNQDSALVQGKQFKGKVLVADFFFTHCSTICPGMTRKMKELQTRTRDLASHIQFVSFSIDPRKDQPAVLKEYIKLHDIETKNWVFLTGDEDFTHELGVNHFYIHAASDSTAVDGYAHAEAFSLVDREGYVRGVYNVQNSAEIKRLEKELRKLLKEEYGIPR